MTDLDAACLVKELQEYNVTNQLKTPQMDEHDTIFGCALDHALRALMEKAGVKPEAARFTKNPNGSFSVCVDG